MAIAAGGTGVRGLERELGLVVIERRGFEGRGRVAGRAVPAELAAMDVLLGVAVDARGLHGPERLAGHVARGTGGRRVAAVELEPGDGVLERVPVKPRYVRAAAFVLGVTRGAVGAGLQGMTVEAALEAQIRGNVFVAVGAQRLLPVLVGPIVALRAVGFELGMRLGEVTGRQQLLELTRRRSCRREGEDKRADDSTEPCSHQYTLTAMT